MKPGIIVMGLVLVPSLWLSHGTPDTRVKVPCTWTITWWENSRPDHAVLAVATSDWREARRVDLPFFEPPGDPPRPWVDRGPPPADFPTPPDTFTIYRAQRFVVVQVGEGASHDLEAGEGLWVVPEEGCIDPWPLTRNEWVPSGDTVTFLVDPNDVAVGSDGAPTFRQNVQFGPHPGSREAGERHELSGPEFFRFVHALPTREALASNPRTALEAFGMWVSSNVDSTAFPVASALSQLEGHRDRNPIYWVGYPDLTGCYVLEYEPEPDLHPLLDGVERRIYLSEVLAGSRDLGIPMFVVRPAPGVEASDFTSVVWAAWPGEILVNWSKEGRWVTASFDANPDEPAAQYEGLVKASYGEVSDEFLALATLTRVDCAASQR